MIAFSVAMGCFADSNTGKKTIVIKIEGVYHIKGQKNSGLSIKKFENGNYLIRKIFIEGNDTIHYLEWQSAYVEKNETNKYMFYWHTGRFDDSIPESNTLIVYELKATENGFEGIYFFPEETRNPPAHIVYIKIE